jgi:transposase
LLADAVPPSGLLHE